MASRLYDQLYRQAQVELAGILQGEERSIIKLYGTALHDIRKILKNLYDKYSVEGKLTNGEMSKYNRLANVQDQICRILQKNMKQVDSLTKRLTAEQYSEAFYRHAYAIDQVGGMALNWGLIPEEAVEAAIKSPFSKLASSKALAASREGTVDRIRQEIGLSIIRGDSYDVLANRISAVLGVSPKGAGAAFNGKGAAYRSLMVARTEGQRILVEGQMAATQKALELGCEIETIWDATLDGRTRPAHAALDGRPKDDPEKGWLVPEIGYVTAPLHSGVASFDINCRCRTRDQVKGFPPEKRYIRGDGKRPYQTYNEWKKQVRLGSVGDIPENWKFSKRTINMDVKNQLALVNYSNYQTGKYEWTHNCQRCVPAYELRRRGYNVVAKPSTGIFDRLQIEWNSMYNGFKSIKCSSDNPAQEIVGYLNSIRGNARCEVWCMWSRDEGHVFVAEKIGKDVIFLDPQSNRINCIDYFEKALKGSIEFGRTDNLTFSSIISECCEYIGR